MSSKIHGFNRRTFIKAAGALGAAAVLPWGLSGCAPSGGIWWGIEWSHQNRFS